MQQIHSTKSLFYKSKREEPIKKEALADDFDESSSDTEDPLKPCKEKPRPKPTQGTLPNKPIIDVSNSHSSFMRNSGDSVLINYGDYNKQSADFSILDNESRAGIIEDLFEFDKCFYLNNYSIDIYPNNPSKFTRQEGDQGVHWQNKNEA